MKLFDQPLTVTLTTAEWLALQIALSDAWEYNLAKNFPVHAAENVALKRAIAAQSQAAINAAAEEIDQRRAARAA
jgi:hypothetical protein